MSIGGVGGAKEPYKSGEQVPAHITNKQVQEFQYAQMLLDKLITELSEGKASSETIQDTAGECYNLLVNLEMHDSSLGPSQCQILNAVISMMNALSTPGKLPPLSQILSMCISAFNKLSTIKLNVK